MDPAGPRAPHLASIHYLRGVAAIMVVAYHSFSQSLVPIHDPQRVMWLKHGVAIFFVISGFVMVSSTADGERDPWRFLARRVRRIAPLYWIATLCWVAVRAFTDGDRLIASMLFVPWVDPATGAVRDPVLDVGWTLNLEMFFYAAFALSMTVPRRWATWGLAVGLLLLPHLHGAVGHRPLIGFYLSPVLAEFAGGMLIAHLGVRAPIWCLPAGFAALALAPAVTDARAVAVTAPALLIVASARSLDRHLPRWRLPWLVGDASYAIYLAHLFVLLYVARIFQPLPPPAAAFALCVVGSVVVGILVHRTIELPIAGAWRARPRFAEQRVAVARR